MLRKIARRVKKAFYSSSENRDGLGRKWELDSEVFSTLNREIIESGFTGTPVRRKSLPSRAQDPNIVLFAAKKSASTFLVLLLSRVFECPHVGIGFNRGGGQFYYPRVLSAVLEPTPTVSRCHAPAAWYTLEVVEALDLIPLVLTRNLLDSLVSWRDHTLRAGRAEELLSEKQMEDFGDMTNEEQMDVVIDSVTNRYVNFFRSWKDADLQGARSPLFITYNDVKETPVRVVQRVAEHAGLSFDANRAKETANTLVERKEEANYNKGVSGRGRENLTENQIYRIGTIAENMGVTDPQFLGFEPK